MPLGYGGKSALASPSLDWGHQVLFSAAEILLKSSSGGGGGGRLIRESVEIQIGETGL